MTTYDIRDICNRYNVHEQTVLAWIHGGELVAVNVGTEPGKKRPRWRITQQALDAFEAARASQPAAATPAARTQRTPRRRKEAIARQRA